MNGPLETVVPLIFLAHDLEEALQTERMAAVAEEARRRLPAPLEARVPDLRHTRAGMLAFAAGAFSLQALLPAWARRSPRGMRVLRGVLIVRLANGVAHIVESLALRRYVPGTASSPAIVLAAALLLRSVRRPRA